VCSAPEETRAAPPSEDSNDAVHRRFLKESPAMFKDGVMEVSKDNEIAYSEVAKVSPCNTYLQCFGSVIGSGWFRAKMSIKKEKNNFMF
jgi:hypothetical protein